MKSSGGGYFYDFELLVFVIAIGYIVSIRINNEKVFGILVSENDTNRVIIITCRVEFSVLI